MLSVSLVPNGLYILGAKDCIVKKDPVPKIIHILTIDAIQTLAIPVSPSTMHKRINIIITYQYILIHPL